MEEQKLKQNMKSLWMETFKDSSEYVELVFDNYFNPATSVWHIRDGVLEASILGIEYEFRARKDSPTMKGLYLCGISTRKESRKQGIMSHLLEEINEKAGKLGYDFTFLIPSDERNRLYYSRRGYHNSFYNMEQHFVHGYNFNAKREIMIEDFRGVDITSILDFLESESEERCENGNVWTIIHTRKDWDVILKEALISGEEIKLAKEDGRIVGMAFLQRKKELDRDEIRIKKLITIDEETERSFLSEMDKKLSQTTIVLVKSPDDINIDSSQAVWKPFYASSNNESSEYEEISDVDAVYSKEMLSVPFGMIRILDINNFLNKFYDDECKNLSGYTTEEEEEILLRKPISGDDELKKLLDLPIINLSMFLLLE